MARGKRTLVDTCIGHVITRYMVEAKLNYRELYEHTGISKSTLHGWANGVVMENPDVLLVFKKVFTDLLKREITVEELLYGKDEDKEKMKQALLAKDKEIMELSKQLALFELDKYSA